MSDDHNHRRPPTSPTRRKVLTGLLGASAVAAMAPQQWTQPVLKRMITPAHGQAFSIAAGIYTFQFIEEFLANINTITARINWPGGLGPVEDITVEIIGNAPGDVTSLDPPTTSDFNVRIGSLASADPAQDYEPVAGSASPALPGGLVFIVSDP